jgi:hypothetical protein
MEEKDGSIVAEAR